jgi:hypothetical protein
MMRTITVRRAAKINTGNYENTDVFVELVSDVPTSHTYEDVADSLLRQADTILKKKIDDIELGKREAKSKAGRFGV